MLHVTRARPPLFGGRGFCQGRDTSIQIFLARMTALSKKDGGIRGIASGFSFRRVVRKSLVRQFGAILEQVCTRH